jgi:hypothetical protein
MKQAVRAKIEGAMLDGIRQNLAIPHHFAHERVGFLRAALAEAPGRLLVLVRGYQPVADGDYEEVYGAGATIGSDAMRKAVQWAYRPAAALIHIHTHGGSGLPAFSGVDLRSAGEYVPGFFETVPKMPHGIVVLSNNAATGLLWLSPERKPVAITEFIRVGAPLRRQWSAS